MQFLFAFAIVDGYAGATAGIVDAAFAVDVVYGNATPIISTVADAFDILVIK